MDKSFVQYTYDNLFENLQFAYSVTRKLSEALEAEIQSHAHFFCNTIELYNHLREIIFCVDTHIKWEYHNSLNELINTQCNEATIDRLRQRIDETIRIIASLTPAIKYIYGSNIHSGNWGVVSFFDRFCRELDPNTRVIIRPRWEYTHSYRSITNEIQEIANRAYVKDTSLRNSIISVVQKSHHFISLAYPPTSSKNILQLAIWSHEIAHHIDNIHGIYISMPGLSTDSKKNPDIITPQSYEPISVQTVTEYLGNNQEIINLKKMNDLTDCLKLSKEDPAYKSKYMRYVLKPLATMIANWATEIFADIMSIRLFGLAPLMAFHDFVIPLCLGNIDTVENQWYPSLRIRLKVLLDEYDRWISKNPSWVEELGETEQAVYFREICNLKTILTSPEKAIIFSKPIDPIYEKNQDAIRIFYSVLSELIEKFILVLLPNIDRISTSTPQCFLEVTELSDNIEYILAEINNGIPPDITNISCNEEKFLALLLNAGWLYWKAKIKPDEKINLDDYDKSYILLEKLNTILLIALENADATRWYASRSDLSKFDILSNNYPENSEPNPIDYHGNHSGIILRPELTKLIDSKEIQIIPILDKTRQIGSCSFDIRLGNEFILTKSPNVSLLNPANVDMTQISEQYLERIYLPYGKPFILHPTQFVLASTLEYIKIPDYVFGLLIGRASWGKMGLLISTPNKINPGYLGSLTLQLANVGNIPISLYPLARLGQIIFFRLFNKDTG